MHVDDCRTPEHQACPVLLNVAWTHKRTVACVTPASPASKPRTSLLSVRILPSVPSYPVTPQRYDVSARQASVLFHRNQRRVGASRPIKIYLGRRPCMELGQSSKEPQFAITVHRLPPAYFVPYFTTHSTTAEPWFDSPQCLQIVDNQNPIIQHRTQTSLWSQLKMKRFPEVTHTCML